MLQCPKCGAELVAHRAECPACRSDASLWLGRDGQTFGPYTLNDLQQAQALQRIGPADQIMVGSEGQWVPVGQVLPVATPKAPPPPVPPPPPVTAPVAPARGTTTPIPLIVAIVVIASFLPILIGAAILFPVFAKAREKARQTSCMSNLKQLELGMLMYSQDWDERFPPRPQSIGSIPSLRVATPGAGSPYAADDWRTRVHPYIKNTMIFICPTTTLPDSYNCNDLVYGVGLGDVTSAQSTVCLHEKGFLGPPSPPPHNHGYNVGYVDGHVRWQAQPTGSP